MPGCLARGIITCAGASMRFGTSRRPPRNSRVTHYRSASGKEIYIGARGPLPEPYSRGRSRTPRERSSSYMKQHLFTVFKLVVSVGLLAFLIYKVGLADIISIAATADY